MYLKKKKRIHLQDSLLILSPVKVSSLVQEFFSGLWEECDFWLHKPFWLTTGITAELPYVRVGSLTWILLFVIFQTLHIKFYIALWRCFLEYLLELNLRLEAWHLAIRNYVTRSCTEHYTSVVWSFYFIIIPGHSLWKCSTCFWLIFIIILTGSLRWKQVPDQRVCRSGWICSGV